MARVRMRPRHWSLASSVVVSLAALLSAAVVVLVSGWLAMGRPALPTRFEDTGQFFEAVRIGLYIVAGLGAAVGLTVSYRKQRGEEEGAYTTRYTSASEQLGHDKAAVRLAGIHALTRLADDWQSQRQTCIDVLCAYLRMPCDALTAPAGEREVRLTIMRSIRQHLVPEASTSWEGHDFDFTGATLDGGTFAGAIFRAGVFNFAGSTFSGNVSFNSTTFGGALVSFAHAKFLQGGVDFSKANFTGGAVRFDHATFTGGGSYFLGATFSGGDVNFSQATVGGAELHFNHATFSGSDVNFWRANFSSGRVSFYGATFSGGDVRFSNTTFSGSYVDFGNATISGGHLWFYGAVVSEGVIGFRGTQFLGGDVTFSGQAPDWPSRPGASFSGGAVDFRGANFAGSLVDFSDADFRGGLVDLSLAVDWRDDSTAHMLVHGIPRAPTGLPDTRTPGLCLLPGKLEESDWGEDAAGDAGVVAVGEDGLHPVKDEQGVGSEGKPSDCERQRGGPEL